MRFPLLLLIVLGLTASPAFSENKKLLSGTVHSVDVGNSSLEIMLQGMVARIKFTKNTTITFAGKTVTIQSVSEGDKIYVVCNDNLVASSLRIASKAKVEPREPESIRPSYAIRFGEKKKQSLKQFGGNEETEKAVELGLAWLAKHQKEDGGWEFDGGVQYDRLAATGMALLSFLGAGETPASRKYGKAIARGLDFLNKELTVQRKMERGIPIAFTNYSLGDRCVAVL